MSRPASDAELPSIHVHFRRVAIMVGVALTILLVGALLRPRAAPPVAVPTNELATLPELSQRRMMRDWASYIGERAASFAGWLVPIPGIERHGLLIGADSVLAVEPNAGVPFQVLRLPQADSALGRPPFSRVDSFTTKWVLLVARGPDHKPLSIAGLVGGVVPVSCGPLRMRELILPVTIPPSFLSAAAFDLDGNAIAVAGSCGGRIALVSLTDVMRSLRLQAAQEQLIWPRYGFRTTAADSAATMGAAPPEAGVMVTEVLLDSPADRAGLWPGDTIRRAGDFVVTRPAQLASILDTASITPLEIERGGRTVMLSLDPEPEDSHTARTAGPPGVPLGRLEPDSRGARAGLQPGDLILEIGRRRNPTAAMIQRALTGTTPVLVVYQRDRRRVAAILP